MSAPDSAGLFEILSVKRTELIGKLENLVSVFSDEPERDPNDTMALPDVNTESEPSDWFEHYGFASRPMPKAEHFVIRFGANVVSLASRMVEAVKNIGKLNEGDVAVYSIGGNVIRLNANGSISVLVPTENGKQLYMRLSPKGAGSIKGGDGEGRWFEFSSENGFAVDVGDKDITLSCKHFQVIGTAANMNVGTNKLWAGASGPLLGGASSQPAPGVFV